MQFLSQSSVALTYIPTAFGFEVKIVL